jgi:hypothetical protein
MTALNRILIVTAALACAAAGTSRPAGAQPAAQPAAPVARGFSAGAAQAGAAYAAFAQGQTLTSGGQTYVVLPEARAIAADPGREPAGLDVVERKGRFVVYREPRGPMQHARPMLAEDASGGTAVVTHAVVLNRRTGRSGVVLGSIAVKLSDMSQAAALAAEHGLTLTSRFDHLGVAFLTAAPGQDIAAATAALRADWRVASADPEILETPRTPK